MSKVREFQSIDLETLIEDLKGAILVFESDEFGNGIMGFSKMSGISRPNLTMCLNGETLKDGSKKYKISVGTYIRIMVGLGIGEFSDFFHGSEDNSLGMLNRLPLEMMLNVNQLNVFKSLNIIPNLQNG